MTESIPEPSSQPISAFKALLKGFDRLAAAPLLILPSLILDLLLWLGPHLKISSLVALLASWISIPSEATAELVEQLQLLRTGLIEIGSRFNLTTALSSLPVGIPSLMSSRMPLNNPLGSPLAFDLDGMSMIIGAWLLLTVVGLGLGVRYQFWIARQAAPESDPGKGLRTWSRMLILAVIAYVFVTLYVFISLMMTGLASAVHPFIGMLVLFLAISLLFWLLIYLAFTPHGIVRYRLGVIQALVESAAVVRWSLIGTMGFLGMAFVINWLTLQIWILPPEDSWFVMLSILGHAFVSSMLWLGSYIYYQERREFLLGLFGELRFGSLRGGTPRA
ncbi:MAG: hypothetical protein PVI78_00875 [Anaerolineales bacterium]|jgi:hypothetical protein